MGCISSKRAAASASPCFEYSAAVADNGSVVLEPSSSSVKNKATSTNSRTNSFSRSKSKSKSKPYSSEFKKNESKKEAEDRSVSKESVKKAKKDKEGSHHSHNSHTSHNGGKGSAFSIRLGFSNRSSLEAEQIAAGWPSWLSTAATEAIYGWVPLRADSYEKLEKVRTTLPTSQHLIDHLPFHLMF